MDHVYERNFPAATGAALVVPAGSVKACFELDFPQAGTIRKLIVAQSAGADINFSVNLYNRQVCVPVFDEDNSSVSAGGSAVSDALAKIIPTQAALAGIVMELFAPDDGGVGWSYRNMDAAGTFSVPIRKIYLEIVHAAALADTEWEAAIAVVPAM